MKRCDSTTHVSTQYSSYYYKVISTFPLDGPFNTAAFLPYLSRLISLKFSDGFNMQCNTLKNGFNLPPQCSCHACHRYCVPLWLLCWSSVYSVGPLQLAGHFDALDGSNGSCGQGSRGWTNQINFWQLFFQMKNLMGNWCKIRAKMCETDTEFPKPLGIFTWSD